MGLSTMPCPTMGGPTREVCFSSPRSRRLNIEHAARSQQAPTLGQVASLETGEGFGEGEWRRFELRAVALAAAAVRLAAPLLAAASPLVAACTAVAARFQRSIYSLVHVAQTTLCRVARLALRPTLPPRCVELSSTARKGKEKKKGSVWLMGWGNYFPPIKRHL